MADLSHDDEYQRQGADPGPAAQLENADTLDGPLDTEDPDLVMEPRDRPLVSEDDDMTARGMHEGETLDERLRREEPETPAAGEGRVLSMDDGDRPGETEPPLDPAALTDRAADAEVDLAREDDAARIDALRDAAGAAAPASGRADAGDVPGL